MLKNTFRHRGETAIILGAGIWGLFWIPVRYLNDNHVDGLWAVAAIMFAAVPMSLIMFFRYGTFHKQQAGTILLVGIWTGLAATLYFAAIVYTDVLRVVFLFYLLPIWATLLSRLFFGEKIGVRRSLAILLALAGLWLLLGEGESWPVPHNKGDWMAIFSGFFWALCLVAIRNRPDVDAYATSASPFLFGTLFSVIAALILNDATFPSPTSLNQVWPATLLFGTVLMWPAMFGQVWGARLVPAPRAALLTMTEILVATTSAWLLIGTSLSPVAAFGGLVIILAVIIDITTPPAQQPAASPG